LATHFPNAADGVIGVAFVEAVISSSANDGAWTAIRQRPAGPAR
jgi:hypothetical protein